MEMCSQGLCPRVKPDEYLRNYAGRPRPPDISEPNLAFPKSPIYIRKILAGTGFQPLPAQAEAYGYFCSSCSLHPEYKFPGRTLLYQFILHYCTIQKLNFLINTGALWPSPPPKPPAFSSGSEPFNQPLHHHLDQPKEASLAAI
jgi:hypothetical protein